MERSFFMNTNRIGFSIWGESDMEFAKLLWGDSNVTKFICASGRFTSEDIADRLQKEIMNQAEFGVQYWPIFELSSKELIGCCGLRPYGAAQYEIGFHLRPKFWGHGYAVEAAEAVMDYAFAQLKTEGLFAGHNPNNIASAKVLRKLGFQYIGDEYYAPTGLHHPSYELKNNLTVRQHTMKLKPSPFEKIKTGKKTIELRLYDEKRQRIAVGDTIQFVNMENPEDMLFTTVKELFVFASFEELYNTLPLSECGYAEEELGTASYRDMELYYSKEEQNRYGVVGIKISLTHGKDE